MSPPDIIYAIGVWRIVRDSHWGAYVQEHKNGGWKFRIQGTGGQCRQFVDAQVTR